MTYEEHADVNILYIRRNANSKYSFNNIFNIFFKFASHIYK